MHIRRAQGIIQMYTEDPRSWSPHCTLQRTWVYYLNPSNMATSETLKKNLQPLVLHLFVMVDLQGGRIYLKIRTSSKSREVLSTFQPNRAVRFSCHGQNYSWFWTRFLSPYRRVVKLGTNTAQPVLVKTQRGHVDLTECLEELGCHEQHIWDEQNVTNLKNGQQRLRKDTTRSCPHQTRGNFDKWGSR